MKWILNVDNSDTITTHVWKQHILQARVMSCVIEEYAIIMIYNH